MTSEQEKQEGSSVTAGLDGDKNVAASTTSEKRAADTESSSSPVEKRARTDAPSNATATNNDSSKNSADEEETPDLATFFGYKDGDRVQVKWDIEQDVSEEEDNNEDAAAASTKTKKSTRWWSATLLPHDGRTEDSVAIRVLDYDPYPEGGFPERSQEDVIFLGEHHMVTPDSQTDYTYRREGSDYEEPAEDSGENVVWYNEEDLNGTLNEILMSALKKNNHAWNQLPPAEQARLAETIAQKKEKLMDVLKGQKDVITSSSIHGILKEAFKE